MEDKDLISSYLAGNEKSFERLIDRYTKPIFGFIFRLVKDLGIAEDLTQETFLKVWKNFKKFNQEKNFRTWIFAIARNTVWDFLRKKKPILFAELELKEENFLKNNLVDEKFLPDKIIHDAQAIEFLEEVLKKLSLPQQTILWLYFKEGFTLREISEILGESPNTVKSRYQRALKELKKFFPERRDAP